MSWLFSARSVTPRRATVVVAAAVALIGAGLVVGPRFEAKATIVGGGVSVADASANEGNAGGGQLSFAVTTSGVVIAPETVHYKTVDGTAKAGEDYVAKEGDLAISGSGTQNVVIQLMGDLTVEPNETFVLQLSGGTSNNDTGTGTITNDDFSVSVADLTVTEGNSGTANAPVVISLGGGARATATTVQYSTVDGSATAPADYTAANAVTTTIPAGQTSVTVNVPVVGDALYEDDETFRVVLSNPSSGVTIADGDATVKILNNDSPPDPSQQPTISIADKGFPEGDTGTSVGNFALTLSSQVPYTVTVKASTSNNQATADSDYVGFSNVTVTFAPGETSATLPVTINGDTKDEFNEAFTVTLSNPSPGAQVLDGTGFGVITDDDATPTLSVDNASGAEGGKVTFTIKLSEASGRDTVLAVGTANDTATAGSDYTGVPNTTRATIPAGTTVKTFEVDALADSVDEPDETFKFGVSQATNPDATAFADLVIAVGTIKDATATPSLSIADAAQNKGNSGSTPFVFTVTLAPTSGQVVTVNYTVGPDTGIAAALPGTDFTAASGTLSFAPGETTKSISVAVAGDTVAEDNETFKVTLSGPTNALLGDATGLGTIKNDDGAFNRPGAITTGAGAGGGSHVRFFESNGNPVGPGFFATVNGPGVRVARGDLDGDGHDEVIASSGPGGPSLVRVFSSDGSALVAEIDAYPGFRGGVAVAAADVDGDGKDEIITGAGPGGGPHVRTFKLTGEVGNRQLVGSAGFFGLDNRDGYSGGVNVGGGDTDGDGKAEIIATVASNGPPIVAVWKYNLTTEKATLVNFFLAFAQNFRGGVNVAVGDLDGDNKSEIVVGAGPGGAPHVRVLSPTGGGLPGSAYAYRADFPGGVQVAVGDVNGDGDADILTGVGAGGGPHVRAFDLNMNALPTSFYAYDEGFGGGVNVAVGNP